MTTSKAFKALIASALAALIALPVTPASTAHADDLTVVEGARAKDRQGRRLSRMDREALRRYGGNSDDYYDDDHDHGWRGGGYGSRYRSSYGYYNGYASPGVSIYIGPGRRYHDDD